MLSSHQFNLLLESIQSKDEIAAWLDEMGIENYIINDDLTVDVDGDANLFGKGLKSIPVKFNKVGGDFWCSYNPLTTLKGAPNEVGGSFWCSSNQLTTLKGAPNKIGGDFYCYDNQLKSLDGKPDYVGGGFFIDDDIYDRLFPPDQDKVWTLDDIDEEPAREGFINIKDEIY
jgi:hypothetical protein